MKVITEQRVTRVVDGETFETADGPNLIGLAGVDAPGLRTKIGESLRRSLDALIGGKQVRIEAAGEDADGRSLAQVELDGKSVNDLVRAAVQQRDESKDGPRAPKITDKVGNGRTNHPADVLWVKQAMSDLGRYTDRHDRTGYIDRDLHDAICCYQRDRGLRRDGWMKPGGETERTMRVQLAYLDKEDGL